MHLVGFITKKLVTMHDHMKVKFFFVFQFVFQSCSITVYALVLVGEPRGVFRPRQTRQLPRAVDLKGRLLSCQSH